MNPLVAFALTGVPFAVFIASLAVRLSRAPGWAHLRGLAAIALACGAISAARAGEYLLAGTPTVVVALRAELAATGACLVAWLAYSRSYLGLGAARAERALSAFVLLASFAALVPGIAYGPSVTTRTLPPGLTFTDPAPSAVADLIYAACAVGGFALVARFVAAWRRGVRGASSHLLGVVLAGGPIAWDAAVAVTGARLPYVTDPGLFFSLGIVPLALAETFRADAASRRTYHTGLEALVAARTTALTDRRRDLARSDQLASVGRLAAGVSHEVNSPLAAARANVDWLLEEPNDGGANEEVVAALDDATRALDRVRRIVRQLAHLTGAPATPGRTQRVLIEPALQQAARLAAALRGQRIAIGVEPTPADLAASADEGALVQVVVNLVVNALDAVDEAGGDAAVVVRAAREGDRVVIAVEDRGAGMSAETLARVFEPFFTTKAVGRGTGLGLAVSRALVTAAGGALRVASRLGEGTRVTLELPAAREEPPPSEAPRETAVPERRRRILLVDDEPAVRSALRRLLSRYHDVALAGGVDEALAAMERGDFDLVLCDVVMPDGGGERLYREAAARSATLAARFVFVTGGAPDDATRRFLADQPQPVLDKPVDLASLEAAALAIAPVSPSRGARAGGA